jgi:hypothetical protein
MWISLKEIPVRAMIVLQWLSARQVALSLDVGPRALTVEMGYKSPTPSALPKEAVVDVGKLSP